MLIPLSEDNLSDKIIFNNNTGYLILMLGAVGYSPVVTPHRIKQVCKPYRVVKVAAECSLLARSTNEGSSPFIALMSAHRRKSMHRHKGKCNKKNMPSQYHQLSTQKGIDLTQIYPKGIEVPYWASEIR